jgi:hypothetical protein
MKKYFLFCCINLFAVITLFSQNAGTKKDSTDNKEKSWKVFGSIYGGFYYKLKAAPNTAKSAFEVKTGILGFKNQFNEKVDATIVFDVSKTTRDIKDKYDTTTISYTEGNNYTAYLKQADIHWTINKYAELSLGMLLSSQYLLTQDKFWEHRYIEYTFQETGKYGNPADFGARIKLHPAQNISVTLNMLNGDGPARWQDDKGKFLYTADVEYKKSDYLVLRIYGDYKEAPTPAQKAQSVLNGFAGYVYKNCKVAAEYSLVHNVNYLEKNIWGASAYAIYKFKKKFQLLARYDYFQDITLYKDNQYLIAGIQYEPVKNYFLSLNYRNSQPTNISQIYLNFGAKF